MSDLLTFIVAALLVFGAITSGLSAGYLIVGFVCGFTTEFKITCCKWMFVGGAALFIGGKLA